MKIKAILFSFICLLLASCCKPRVVYIKKPLYIKCKIPEVPNLEEKKIPKNASYSLKLKIILDNYLRLKKENKLLRKAIQACQ